MNSKRQKRLESVLGPLEVEYRAKLIASLEKCAAGNWGLFGQNDHIEQGRYAAQMCDSSGANTLMRLGAEITALRQELGISEPFPLHTEFLRMQGRKSDNDLGEARLAQMWLAQMTP